MSAGDFISLEGRAGRSVFWFAFVASVALTFLAGSLPETQQEYWRWAPFLCVAILSQWLFLAAAIKRYHEREKSGWWVFIALLPIIGIVWQVVELGFLRARAPRTVTAESAISLVSPKINYQPPRTQTAAVGLIPPIYFITLCAFVYFFPSPKDIEAYFKTLKNPSAKAAYQALPITKSGSEPSAQVPRGSYDPKDIVAQVLNYTTWGYDEGRDGQYWWKDNSKPCLYRKRTNSENLIEGVAVATAESLLGGKNKLEIDFTELDLKNLKFGMFETVNVFVVAHEGRTLLATPHMPDQDRVIRGWELIYAKYCKGREKPF